MTEANKKQLKLATLLIAPGASNGGWRHSNAESFPEDPLAFFTALAQKAEQGKIDYLFMADQYRIPGKTADEIQYGVNVWPEPITLLSALCSVTKHIGLSATQSTTYAEPYHTARMFATLDHLSKGRASWNIVTSNGELESVNFKNEHRPVQERRHEHSDQFVEIVKALWDSWEDGAIVQNKQSGIFADSDKVHYINHDSEWFSVQGPLNVARPPQGHPVMVQAGQSEAFIKRAAETADVIFTMLGNLEQAKQFYASVKQKLPEYSRRPQDLLIMPGLTLSIGSTEQEAREKKEYFSQLGRNTARLDIVSYVIGKDITDRSLDDALPEADLTNPAEAKYVKLKQLADLEGWKTIRQLYDFTKNQKQHFNIVGTPIQIADQLEQWLVEDGADGFTFIPHILPSAIHELVDLVIPELQNRGIFRTEYTGSTLRDNLGLSKPENRFAKAVF